MSSRRSHQNSHHGCQQCKIARKKVRDICIYYTVETNPRQCDEQQPECRRCLSKNRRCHYRHLLSSYNAFQTCVGSEKLGIPVFISPIEAKAKLNTVLCSPNDALFGSSSEPRVILSTLGNCTSIPASREDICYLTHHYFTVISPSAANTQPHLENFHGWDAAVQQYWAMHDFVQHGICALSSLHLACKTNESEARMAHLANGMKLQNAGLAHFRVLLSSDEDLPSSVLEACITFSGILSLCAFSSVTASRTLTSLNNRKVATNPIFDIVQAMSLIRGIRALNRLHESKKEREFARRDGISKFLRQRWEGTDSHHHLATLSGISDGEASLNMLTEYIQRTMSLPGATVDMQQEARQECLGGKSVKDIYLTTIIQLKPSIRCYALWPGIARFVYRFASIVQSNFLTLLEQQHPVALVILGHYAVCLHALRQYWWAGSLGRDIGVAVVDELIRMEDSWQGDTPWSQLMAWPMRALNIETKMRKRL